jgi:hypothetical protein
MVHMHIGRRVSWLLGIALLLLPSTNTQGVLVRRQLTLVADEWFDWTGTLTVFRAIQTPPGHLPNQECYELVLTEGSKASHYTFTRLPGVHAFVPVAYFGLRTSARSSINFTLQGQARLYNERPSNHHGRTPV